MIVRKAMYAGPSMIVSGDASWSALSWLAVTHIPCRFPCMDGLFPGFTPMIPAELTVLLNDAVAGYQERDGVCTHRQPHGSRRIRMAYCGCHLGIARHGRRSYL